ncbi:MAG TPA: HAD family hydrolase [Candidatus Saccharibacteria bacterium]|nr:HAD family hydrolase [Candidatus Saccharibacteria bacterium]HRQ07278.1 HAD family hydrolase [Candidatus Saccharibacteria bacterium]
MDRYDYFLFDWDGCLAKTLDAWLDAYKTAFKNHNLEPSDLEIAYHLGDWEIGKYFDIVDYVKFNESAVKLAIEKLKSVELYDGAAELITNLKKSKKLALVSSGSREIIENGLKHNDIEEIFDFIITGEDVTNHKPHPESLELALSAINGTKKRAIMIGDSNKDIGAATNFGIDSVLVYPDSHKLFYDLRDLQKLKPTYTISKFSDLAITLG